MKALLTSLLTLVLVLSCLGTSELHAQSIRVEGTKASLTPPKEFVKAKLFTGFQHSESGSSIVVTEIQAPMSVFSKGLTKESLAKGGMELLSSEKIALQGFEGFEFHVAQTASGIDFLKWMLVLGDEESCLMVVGSFPKAADDKLGAEIRASIRGGTWTPDQKIDFFEGLEFRFTPTKKLKLAGRMTNMLMLTGSGKKQVSSNHEPLMIVGHSYSDQKIEDPKAFSEARASETASLQEFEILHGREVKLGKMTAYELLLKATDKKSGEEMRLLQVMAPSTDRYYLIQGIISARKWKRTEVEFRSVIESFELVPDEGEAAK